MLRQLIRQEQRDAAQTVLVFALAIIVVSGVVAGFTQLLMGFDLGTTVIVALVSILPGTGCLLISRCVMTRRAPVSKLLRHLRQYGKAYDVIDRIDAEVGSAERKWQRGESPHTLTGIANDSIIITESWLLHFWCGTFAVVRISDLLWLHKRIVANSGWTPGSSLVFQIRGVTELCGEFIVSTAGEEDVDRVIERLVRSRPDLLVGYRMEWHDLATNGREKLRNGARVRQIKWQRLSQEDRLYWRQDQLNDAVNFVQRYDMQIHNSLADPRVC